MKDNYPVSKDHCLIVPKRHAPDYFSMTTAEKMDSENLLRILQKRISNSDSSVTGFNVGMNCGESAGQTIFHAHIHLIPRRDGDITNPINFLHTAHIGVAAISKSKPTKKLNGFL